MNRYELNDWQDEQLHISIVALYSGWPDYRLAHYLNHLLETRFKNKYNGFLVQTKNQSSSFSYFKGLYHFEPIYLVVNKSYTASSKIGSGLFADQNIGSDQYLIPRLRKWPYFLLSTGSKNKGNWNPLTNTKLISTQLVDFNELNKTDQNTINDFIYAE